MTFPDYSLRPLRGTSATALSTFLTCEAQGGYGYLYEGVPDLGLPAPLIYGIAVHALVAEAGSYWWKTVSGRGRPLDADEGANFVRRAPMFIGDALTERRAPRYRDRLRPILWWGQRRSEAEASPEVKARIAEYIKNARGRARNALEALLLSFMKKTEATGMIFEFQLRDRRVQLAQSGQKLSLPVTGSVDLVIDFPNCYTFTDFKTGQIARAYRDRLRLLGDLQLSIYEAALKEIRRGPPGEIFIQPLEFSNGELANWGPEALERKRISVPARTEDHRQELAGLASDLFVLTDSLVSPEQYGRRFREEWQAETSFARRALWQESVQEGRPKPRIGVWCEECRFLPLCRKDNADDWKNHEARGLNQVPDAAPRPLPEKTGEPLTGLLFSTRRPPYVPKADRVIRAELLKSGAFVTRAKVMPLLNKLREWLGADGECHCIRFGLYPLWLLGFAERIFCSKRPPSRQELAAACPYEGCPRLAKHRQTAG